MTISLDNQKAIFWGEFIEIAFSMYATGVTNPTQPTNFPKGWRLVKNINAVADVSVFSQKEFIGFVAQSLNDHNHFAVVLHGTEGFIDFLDDFEFLKTDFKLIPDGGKTEYGFTRFYESFFFVDPIGGNSENLKDYLKGLPRSTSFTVAGYSLGAALATLHSAVLAHHKFSVEIYTFASPMVGDTEFVNTYNSLVPNSYHIFNKPDIVPQLPGPLLGYKHVKTIFEINSLNFPGIKRTISSFHSLNVYLYVLGASKTSLESLKAEF